MAKSSWDQQGIAASASLGALGQVPAWGLWLDPPPPVQHRQGLWVLLLLSQGCALAVVSSWLNFGLLLKCCTCQGQKQCDSPVPGPTAAFILHQIFGAKIS